ncbi:DUF6338 family protein [Mycobacterium marinum]|uniref:DUF6338 family protein n=1 Tax=Mycobacterium marinum TaxID=1781 RepID=UPI0038B74894
MIGTFQALLVTLVAVLPGAVYSIALENRGASWAWPKSDASNQVIRFLGASAAFHVLFAPLTYWAYQTLIVTRVLSTGGRVAWYWWPILLGYLVIPYTWGECTVRSRRWDSNSCGVKRVTKWFVGLYTATAPEPRAWDWLFSKPNLTGVVRLQLNTDEWKVGLWGGDSYASSYGEDGDLYIADQYALKSDWSLDLDDAGEMRSLGVGLLIRWSEVRYLEFSELPVELDEGEGSDDGEATCWARRKPEWWRRAERWRKARRWKPGWWRQPRWWRKPEWRRKRPEHQRTSPGQW